MADAQTITMEIGTGAGAIISSGTVLTPVVSTIISTPIFGTSLVAATQAGAFVSIGTGLGTALSAVCPFIPAAIGVGLVAHGIYQIIKES